MSIMFQGGTVDDHRFEIFWVFLKLLLMVFVIPFTVHIDAGRRVLNDEMWVEVYIIAAVIVGIP